MNCHQMLRAEGARLFLEITGRPSSAPPRTRTNPRDAPRRMHRQLPVKPVKLRSLSRCHLMGWANCGSLGSALGLAATAAAQFAAMPVRSSIR